MIHHNVYGTYEPIPIRRKFSLPCDRHDLQHLSTSRELPTTDFDELTRVKSIDSIYDFKETATRRWFESGSLDSIHLGSSLQIFNEKFYNIARRESRRPSMYVTALQMVREESDDLIEVNDERQTELDDLADKLKKLNESGSIKQQQMDGMANGIVMPSNDPRNGIDQRQNWFHRNFDIKLLRDKVYLNIMVGVSLAGFAEFNFIVFTPLLLEEMHFGTVQICSVMSMIGSTDILFRFVAPFIGDYLNQPPRIMFMVTLILLIVSRMGKRLVF